MNESEQQWHNQREVIEPVLEKMVLAGWVKRFVVSPQGCGISWTPEGLQRMQELWGISRELEIKSFDPALHVGLYGIVFMAAHDKGWK